MRALLPLALGLLLPAAAHAGARDGGASLLLGVGSPFDEDPQTARLSIRGSSPLTDGDLLAVGGVLPVTFTSSGSQAFGISTDRLVIEVPASLRLQVLNELPFRPYLDLGIGPVFGVTETDTWFSESTSSRVGWMTNSTLGASIGDEEGTVAVRVEPAVVSTYHFGDDRQVRWAGMVGIGATF
jgi:hypothetical protein